MNIITVTVPKWPFSFHFMRSLNSSLSYPIIFFYLFWPSFLFFLTPPPILPTSIAKYHLRQPDGKSLMSNMITNFHWLRIWTRALSFQCDCKRLTMSYEYLLVNHNFYACGFLVTAIGLKPPINDTLLEQKSILRFSTVFYGDKHFFICLQGNLHHPEESPLNKKDFSYRSWKCSN